MMSIVCAPSQTRDLYDLLLLCCCLDERGVENRFDAVISRSPGRGRPGFPEKDDRELGGLTGQHAVPSTNGATRLDRDCGKALAYFRCRQKRALTTQREDDNLTAVLLDELLDCLLFIALGTDLPSRQVGELAQARLQPK
jgi:hypothetical protein